MKWTKFRVNVAFEAIDALSDRMMAMGVEGVQIDDQFLSETDIEAMWASYTDERVEPLAECGVIAYLDERFDVEALKGQVEEALLDLKQYLNIGAGTIEIEVLPDEDYEHKWKEFFKPFRIEDRLLITPIWEDPEVKETDILIRIDPGMAFGTGTHETTALCLSMIMDIEVKNKTMVDVGCGSGILGIAAKKLGASNVVGVDIDEQAISIARENLEHNGMTDEDIHLIHGNLLDHVKDKKDIVVANILADVIIMVLGDVKEVMAQDGVFIASGIIDSKLEQVLDAMKAMSFNIIETRIQGEWAAIKANL